MPTNKDRSDYAEAALTTFGAICPPTLQQDAEITVGDLICDIGHYCDQHGLDFKERLINAIGHWSTERRSSDGEPMCDNDEVEFTITKHYSVAKDA
jgi:hypothetical protein